MDVIEQTEHPVATLSREAHEKTQTYASQHAVIHHI